MQFSNRRLNLALLCAGVSALPTMAAAQTTPDQGNVAIEDIVVTASRQAQTLQDVPMSINVVTGNQLKQLNLFDAKDIARLAPGLEMTNTDGRSNTATLRGISFNPDQGTSPAVDIYLNEIPIDAQTAFTALYDLEQIEVLRGPQGALRGRTAPGGAITLRTRRPDLNDVNGYMQATATEDHAYNVQGGVSLPIIPGKLAVRFSALVDGNRLNQLYNVSRRNFSRSRTESGRVSLAWQATDTFDATVTYQYLHANNRQYQQVFGPGSAPAILDPTRSGPPAQVSDYVAVAEGNARFQNKTHFVNFGLNWDLGPATLSFIGGHQYSLLNNPRDTDFGNSVPNYVGIQSSRIPYKVDTAELRLASNSNDFWNWSLSSFYSRQTGDTTFIQSSDTFFVNTPAALRLYLPVTANIFVPVNSRRYSFAASSNFRFNDKLKLELAARYGNERNVQRAVVTATSPGFAGFPAFGIPAIPGFSSTSDSVPPAIAKTVSHPLTGGATLTYEFSRELTAYAAYGRSFRQGTAGVGVPVNVSSDLIKTSAERSDSFEIGLKSALLNRRLTFNISAFYQKFDGYISRFPSVNYDNGVRNVFGVPSGAPDRIVDGNFDFNYNGDATVKGLEATLAGRPINAWDFSVSASYIKARYDNARLPCNDFDGNGAPDAIGTPRITGTGNVSFCTDSRRLSDIPDFSLTANTEVRFAVADYQPFMRALFTYRPSVFSTRANFNYKSRELLNLYIGLRGPDARWEINVFAKNLFDQNRITNISQGETLQVTSGAPYRSGYRLINATNPREFGITTSFNF